MTKVKVRDYGKKDGTHVRSYTREQSSSPGALGDLPPEEQQKEEGESRTKEESEQK